MGAKVLIRRAGYMLMTGMAFAAPAGAQQLAAADISQLSIEQLANVEIT